MRRGERLLAVTTYHVLGQFESKVRRDMAHLVREMDALEDKGKAALEFLQNGLEGRE